MNIPIKLKSEVQVPPTGYVFPFIDKQDMQLKAKLSDGLVISYANIDSELQILSLNDYSAFEVYAHKDTIKSGDICTALSSDPISVDIPGSTTERFVILTRNTGESDVVVDWGDGNIHSVSDQAVSSYTTNTVIYYLMEHTYQLDGVYTIKIYGKNYYGIRHSYSTEFSGYKFDSLYNLMCRCFSDDLPVARNVTNLARFGYNCLNLVKVSISRNNWCNYVSNYTTAFAGCLNLKSFTGCSFYRLLYCSEFFSNAQNLTTTDFYIPSTAVSFISCFYQCFNLVADVNDLFDTIKFKGRSYAGSTVLALCRKLTGTVSSKLADVLWNDSDIAWTNTGSFFVQCPSNIRNGVPVSWGGTASDDIIKPNLEQKIAKLEQKIAKLQEIISKLNINSES